MTLEEFGLSKEQIDKFEFYSNLLLEWNEKFNLTSITDKDEIVQKHFIDSIYLVKYVDLSNKSLLDVGSGAGFPGIPLAIACPTAKITLLESNGKKVSFLKEAIKVLGLNNVSVIQGRSEELNKREHYDFVTARAVKQLNILLEISVHLLKVKGIFIAYKGDAESELKEAEKAISKLSLEVIADYKYELPFGKRELILLSKMKATPNKYPRNYSQIIKSPL